MRVILLEGPMRKNRKSKEQRGLVTHRIVYANHRRPHDRNQELKVDVRRGTIIDLGYATAMVAVRTPLPLDAVRVIRIESC